MPRLWNHVYPRMTTGWSIHLNIFSVHKLHYLSLYSLLLTGKLAIINRSWCISRYVWKVLFFCGRGFIVNVLFFICLKFYLCKGGMFVRGCVVWISWTRDWRDVQDCCDMWRVLSWWTCDEAECFLFPTVVHTPATISHPVQCQMSCCNKVPSLWDVC